MSVTVDKTDLYRDNLAQKISMLWDNWDNQRAGKKNEWAEVRNYIFATDTSTTSNRSLPWKNSTTFPKLCQIRDNLHSNYLAGLFPNDNWLKWQAYDGKSNTRTVAENITSYMLDRTREGGFREEVDKLLYDYIDYGNAFCTRELVRGFRNTPNGPVETFIGPRIKRISPLDIVFDPTAESFEKAPKIVRKLISIADLVAASEDNVEDSYLKEALKKHEYLTDRAKGYKVTDFQKAEGYSLDGFGNYFEYLDSDMVEILEYYGDIYDKDSKEYHKARVITIIDRMYVIRNIPFDSWDAYPPIFHVGWRIRSDNLWAAGPLDNLVGMQYRIDHIQNLKADAMDLSVLPPIVIQGEVEEFEYAPGSEIHVDEGGGVTELARNVQWVIQADNETAMLEQHMEEFAGAPREAMGIRTPGEKTMFEVQQLQNAAGRIFQEKITTFELFLEKVLNSMLKAAIYNIDSTEIIRVVRSDLGAEIFREVTKDDLNASGVLRPVGARHYSEQAQLFQNLYQIFNSNIYQVIAPHISGKALASLVEDTLGLQKFSLVTPFVGIEEQTEMQQITNSMQEDAQVNQQRELEEGLV